MKHFCTWRNSLLLPILSLPGRVLFTLQSLIQVPSPCRNIPNQLSPLRTSELPAIFYPIPRQAAWHCELFCAFLSLRWLMMRWQWRWWWCDNDHNNGSSHHLPPAQNSLPIIISIIQIRKLRWQVLIFSRPQNK